MKHTLPPSGGGLPYRAPRHVSAPAPLARRCPGCRDIRMTYKACMTGKLAVILIDTPVPVLGAAQRHTPTCKAGEGAGEERDGGVEPKRQPRGQLARPAVREAGPQRSHVTPCSATRAVARPGLCARSSQSAAAHGASGPCRRPMGGPCSDAQAIIYISYPDDGGLICATMVSTSFTL